MTKKTNKKSTTRPRRRQESQSGVEVIAAALAKVLGATGKWIAVVLLGLVALAVGAGYFLLSRATHNEASVSVDRQIGITPTQIASMQQTGRWEFLSVSDEELVDTIRTGFFTDDELIRIYYGTLRLGFDVKDAKEGWLANDGDTLRVTLPRIRLLDENFIDEARTKAFFESGSWSDADREAMYQRARQRMKARAMSRDNVASAEQNASRQFYQMLRSMGFEHVSIRFE